MSAIAIRSKGEAAFRRSGVAFPHDKWLVVQEPTEAQLAEPMLEKIDYNGEPSIRGLPVVGAGLDDEDEAPLSSGPLTTDAVYEFAEQHGLALVSKSEVDAANTASAAIATERDLARESASTLATANQALAAERESVKGELTKANETIAGLQSQLATANATIETLQAQIAANTPPASPATPSDNKNKPK